MTSWNAFEDDGFNGFRSIGFNARNGGLACVPTRRVLHGGSVFGVSMGTEPTNVIWGLPAGGYGGAWDSLGRLWVNMPGNVANVYDRDGNFQFTTTSAGSALGSHVSRGGGRFAVVVDNTGDRDKIVAFSSDGSAIDWTVDTAGAYTFLNIFYVAGIIYAHAEVLPAPGDYKVLAYNANTGAYIGSLHGYPICVGPGGDVIYMEYASVTPSGTFELVRIASDLTTVRWRVLYSALSSARLLTHEADTSRAGVTYLFGQFDGLDYVTIAADGTIGSLINRYDLPMRYMQIDDCRSNPQMYLGGNNYYADPVDPETPPNNGLNSSAISISLASGVWGVAASLSGGGYTRIDGHWSIFT